ncbi:hypothetical protein DL762_008170 [Monosporascus cannonballus]|uniref:RNA polymerase II subunit B1 CTD phosphatase RPAP2 homolog n=1 Tax=Monosporascus cannonballus TaxID=155416 RepID=A0ABY0GWY3_9PEZI|nr:hypothetical protein DL762_008170 [Monosporascus cannonballus]
MASQTKKAPPKGILKKPTVAAPPSPSPSLSASASASASPSPQQKPDPREIAIQHAKIIHDRRALEDTITDSIILLAKLPATKPPSSPSQPTQTTTTTASTSASASASSANDYSEQDAELFRSHVRLFQPSDYDALIEERNALGSCGYGLCGRPRTRLGPGSGGYKLLNWGRRDFAIVPRAEAERWCSRRCARRAMYVKVQLSETAAWERAGIETIRIELLEEQEAEQERQQQQQQQQQQRQRQRQRQREVPEKEKGEDEAAAAAAQVARDETDRRQKAAKDAMDLALERGDTDKKIAAKRRINVTIREKRVVAEVREPSLATGGGGDGHLVLDGYKTKFDPKSETINSNKGGTTKLDAKEEEGGKATG